MMHHVEVYVSDLERSMAFWTPFLERLGYEADPWSDGVSYRKGDEAYLVLVQAELAHQAAGYHRKRVGLNHLAFKGASRAEVDAMSAWVEAAGHRLLYPTRYPYAAGPGHYAMFCEDPDRIKVEVVAPAED